MGYIIKDNTIQKAKKVVLSQSDRKVVFTQTQKQKEIIEKAKKRREFSVAWLMIDLKSKLYRLSKTSRNI